MQKNANVQKFNKVNPIFLQASWNYKHTEIVTNV